MRTRRRKAVSPHRPHKVHSGPSPEPAGGLPELDEAEERQQAVYRRLATARAKSDHGLVARLEEELQSVRNRIFALRLRHGI